MSTCPDCEFEKAPVGKWVSGEKHCQGWMNTAETRELCAKRTIALLRQKLSATEAKLAEQTAALNAQRRLNLSFVEQNNALIRRNLALGDTENGPLVRAENAEARLTQAQAEIAALTVVTDAAMACVKAGTQGKNDGIATWEDWAGNMLRVLRPLQDALWALDAARAKLKETEKP